MTDGAPSIGQRLALFVIKLCLVVFGAVMALALLCGVFVLFCVWGVKRTWARLTGKPVAPWVLRTDPFAMWRQVAAFRRGPGAAGFTAAAPQEELGMRRGKAALADVTDVTPK